MKGFGLDGKSKTGVVTEDTLTVTKELFIRFSPISKRTYVQKKRFASQRKTYRKLERKKPNLQNRKWESVSR